MQNLTGIDHPALAADDLDSLSQWYCDTLGYSLFFEHPEKPVHILKAPDGTLFEMMQKDTTTRPKRQVLTPGWSHLALRVDNLEEAMQHLDGQQVRWLSEVVPAIGGGQLRSFADPEGNMLQVVER
ncbi:MAG: VOC family protein [Tunicatimonas sp.]